MNPEYEDVIESFLNGNLADFREWVKQCSKFTLSSFIYYIVNHHFERRMIIFKQIQLALQD